MTVAGTKEAIMMVEAGAKEVPEMDMLDAILFAHEEIKRIVEFIDQIVAEVGRPKMEVNLYNESGKQFTGIGWTNITGDMAWTNTTGYSIFNDYRLSTLQRL